MNRIERLQRQNLRVSERAHAAGLTQTPEGWHALATNCAIYASEHEFHSHRGIYPLTDHGKTTICIYNNHPYANDPARRDRELASFREFLALEEITELGFATWPPEGDEQPGYTYAMIIDAPEERLLLLKDAYDHLLGDAAREMP